MDAPRLIVRPAAVSDAAAILDVYRNFILNTTVTFEEEVPGVEQYRERMNGIMAEYPFLVCEDGGRVAGFAYAHRHQSRSAYRYGAELSIYLRPHYTNLGIGRAMSEAIAQLLRMQGVQTLYSAVSVPNAASEALHDSMGFTRVGLWKNTGYKKGRWLDIAWYELPLGDYPEHPAPLLTFGQLDPAQVAGVMKAATARINEGAQQ